MNVGTNLLYNYFWEIGHINIFTRRYERVPVWQPALLDSRDEGLRQGFAAALNAFRRSA